MVDGAHILSERCDLGRQSRSDASDHPWRSSRVLTETPLEVFSVFEVSVDGAELTSTCNVDVLISASSVRLVVNGLGVQRGCLVSIFVRLGSLHGPYLGVFCVLIHDCKTPIVLVNVAVPSSSVIVVDFGEASLIGAELTLT